MSRSDPHSHKSCRKELAELTRRLEEAEEVPIQVSEALGLGGTQFLSIGLPASAIVDVVKDVVHELEQLRGPSVPLPLPKFSEVILAKPDDYLDITPSQLRTLRAQLKQAQNEVEYLRDREAHYSKVLGVTDVGQYRADWTSRIDALMEKSLENAEARDRAESRLRDILIRAYKYDDKPHQLYSCIAQVAREYPDKFTEEVIRQMDHQYEHGQDDRRWREILDKAVQVARVRPFVEHSCTQQSQECVIRQAERARLQAIAVDSHTGAAIIRALDTALLEVLRQSGSKTMCDEARYEGLRAVASEFLPKSDPDPGALEEASHAVARAQALLRNCAGPANRTPERTDAPAGSWVCWPEWESSLKENLREAQDHIEAARGRHE